MRRSILRTEAIRNGWETGAAQLNFQVVSKRLELLHELMPTAKVFAVLVNPTNPYGETFQDWRMRRPARCGSMSCTLALNATSIRYSQARLNFEWLAS